MDDLQRVLDMAATNSASAFPSMTSDRKRLISSAKAEHADLKRELAEARAETQRVYESNETNARLLRESRDLSDRLGADIFDILDITGDDLARLRGKNGRSYIRAVFSTNNKDRLRAAVQALAGGEGA